MLGSYFLLNNDVLYSRCEGAVADEISRGYEDEKKSALSPLPPQHIPFMPHSTMESESVALCTFSGTMGVLQSPCQSR